jgi:uncharacterized membrane protein YsdA (DUF1294 family)
MRASAARCVAFTRLVPVTELIAGVYVSMSVVAFALYAADKRRAELGAWRISEATLHLVEFLGGWPGALLAQFGLRHKRRKPGYMAVFWLIVVVHGCAWWYWLGMV